MVLSFEGLAYDSSYKVTGHPIGRQAISDHSPFAKHPATGKDVGLRETRDLKYCPPLISNRTKGLPACTVPVAATSDHRPESNRRNGLSHCFDKQRQDAKRCSRFFVR